MSKDERNDSPRVPIKKSAKPDTVAFKPKQTNFESGSSQPRTASFSGTEGTGGTGGSFKPLTVGEGGSGSRPPKPKP